MRTCLLCARDFRTPYNLRRHYQQFHPLESQPQRLRMSRRSQLMDEAESEEEYDEVSDPEAEEEEERVVDEDEDIDEDDEDDAENDNDGVDDTENNVFDWLIEEAAEDMIEGDNHAELQSRFRRKFAEILHWQYRLRQHPVYKKVMATARDLHDSGGEYDWPEAYETAVEQRKFLLNRLVPRKEGNEDDVSS